jgi:serine/threonine-protein phosphatase 2A regulatory subunit B''
MTSIKMDELMVTWMSSDGVYESILSMIEDEKRKAHRGASSFAAAGLSQQTGSFADDAPPPPPPTTQTDSPSADRKRPPKSPRSNKAIIDLSDNTIISSDENNGKGEAENEANETHDQNVAVFIPPLLPPSAHRGPRNNTNSNATADDQSWEHLYSNNATLRKVFSSPSTTIPDDKDEELSSHVKLSMAEFMDITKDVCRFPSFFNAPLYRRLVSSCNEEEDVDATKSVITLNMLKQFWTDEIEPFDDQERFFRLVKKQDQASISRDDFLPFIEELLATHPVRMRPTLLFTFHLIGLNRSLLSVLTNTDILLLYHLKLVFKGLEFLSNHAEFQEKYAVTVITRIFYTVQRHWGQTGKITLRQLRKSNLLEAMHLVDTEEDINKVTQYFSYEHFYVLYCRFWELDHDRDYLITREDLLKYGDHSLSHLIVDRIFDAAPRPFDSSSIASATAAASAAQSSGTTGDGAMVETNKPNPETVSDKTNTTGVNREYLSYEDFIFFMLSEEDKANEISVRYWFTCIDVDGDGMLNNMEMRSFYAVQLHRMQCLGHEIVPFEDMLCQMMDMIKPCNPDYLVVEDFLQAECAQVSGALFDALFNLNKYLQFEQRDPFMERQKREDEFECDWDRFACIDYNRLAMEEEAREEEAMEIDWVTVDEDDDDADDFNSLGLGGASEAPF